MKMLNNKKILIMGIRNKWSIAYGIAKACEKEGAELIFTYRDNHNSQKALDLIEEFKNAKGYVLNNADNDDEVREVFSKIKEENGMLDGVVHAIANANAEEMRNNFVYTSKEGFSHALEVSCYSFMLAAKIALEADLLKEGASLLTLTYYGSEKVLPGYNIMGVAKAALESSVRYLANDLGKNNIKVNGISAGPIKTLSARGIKDFNDILDIVPEKAPLHRNVTTEDVGNAAVFMLSEYSNAITGQVIYVDNGYSIMGI